MPRFYINFRNGGIIANDDEGMELPDIDKAREIAEESARELIGSAIATGGETIPDAVIITNENGEELESFLTKELLPRALK